MGASGCQVLAKGDLAPLFFNFFVSSWLPLSNLDKGGCTLPFYSFFFISFAMPSPTLSRRGIYCLFCFVLLLLNHHHQDSTKRELAPLFFTFLVASRRPWPSLNRRET